MRLLLCFIIVLGLFSSCASRKELVYFQPDSVILNTSYENNAPKLQAGDILTISITAEDARTTQPFNPVGSYNQPGVSIQGDNPFLPTYTINENGEIDFPKVGTIKLAGLTRTQAIELIRKEVSKYLLEPGVNINIRNFKITVLGEVGKPGSYPVSSDRITILEAIGMAGDLTINGLRKNVLVIREENGQKMEYRLDLTKRESLNSPVYYLSQNDVVYVEPNGARLQSSKYTQNTTVFVSIAGLIITVISVLTR